MSLREANAVCDESISLTGCMLVNLSWEVKGEKLVFLLTEQIYQGEIASLQLSLGQAVSRAVPASL